MKTINKRIKEGQTLKRAVNNHRHSYYIRTNRLKNRVITLLNQPEAYFITFTLDNNHIDLKKATITRKIAQALRHAQATLYILNEDYGGLKGRLHYHALVSFNYQIDYTIINEIYKYGAVNFKPIYNKNEFKLQNYINKQHNHMIKSTASKIIFSRGWSNYEIITN